MERTPLDAITAEDAVAAAAAIAGDARRPGAEAPPVAAVAAVECRGGGAVTALAIGVLLCAVVIGAMVAAPAAVSLMWCVVHGRCF